MENDSHLTDASRDQWSGAASGWAREAEARESGASGSAGEWMLAEAEIEPGQRVLELACGAGDLGLKAARLVGESGFVLCTDFARPMVDIVRERAATADLKQVEARVADAQALDLGRGSFDSVLCRFGYMLMPDPARALANSRDVLARRGRLVLAVWGEPTNNPWLSLITDAVMQTLSASPPPPGTPGPFALSDPARLRALMSSAGLAEIGTERLDLERAYPSAEAWWESALTPTGPLAAFLNALSEEQRSEARGRALVAVGRISGVGELRLPVEVLVAKATRGDA